MIVDVITWCFQAVRGVGRWWFSRHYITMSDTWRYEQKHVRE